MLKDQIKKLNDELYKLKNPSTDLKYTTNRNIFNVLEEGKLAMKKYTEKLITVEKAVFRELSWWEKYKDLIYILAVLLLGLVILKKIGKIAI